jgi:hypothetical protein
MGGVCAWGKTRQQIFEVFRCAVVHLNDISVRDGAGRAWMVKAGHKIEVL